jgi:hypothetical protein
MQTRKQHGVGQVVGAHPAYHPQPQRVFSAHTGLQRTGLGLSDSLLGFRVVHLGFVWQLSKSAGLHKSVSAISIYLRCLSPTQCVSVSQSVRVCGGLRSHLTVLCCVVCCVLCCVVLCCGVVCCEIRSLDTLSATKYFVHRRLENKYFLVISINLQSPLTPTNSFFSFLFFRTGSVKVLFF